MEFSAQAEIKLSVLIRCRNEAQNLRNVLAALKKQKCDFNWELVIVDNDSEDDTVPLCREFGARVVSIARHEFSYGRALNRGVAAARGELVMLLSAHALPVGSYFLTSAVAAFDDPQVAAARCLQIGNTRQISAWHTPRDIHYRSADEQRAAERGNDWVREYPTGGCCVIRRSVWEQIKYDEQLESNEDKLWASQALAQGYKLRCCAEALWLYTRQYGRRARWRRDNRQHLALYRITGHAPLGWLAYLKLVAKTLLAAPFVALRYVVDNIAWHTCLVTIPWQARRGPETGSFPEFELQRRTLELPLKAALPDKQVE
jgi:rhamnosyltransferase